MHREGNMRFPRLGRDPNLKIIFQRFMNINYFILQYSKTLLVSYATFSAATILATSLL